MEGKVAASYGTVVDNGAKQQWRPVLDCAFFHMDGYRRMLGGALTAAAAILHNMQPIGCVSLGCDTGSMRTATTLGTAVGIVGTLLILVGIAGMILLARRFGRNPRSAAVGIAVAAAGFLMLLAGSAVQIAFFAGDYPGRPMFVVSGLLAVVTDFLMIGIFILRARIFLDGWGPVL